MPASWVTLTLAVAVHLSPQSHTTHSGAHVKMAAEKVPDVRDLGGQRKHIPHGNMRVKLLDYIGQVFECKADNQDYSRRVHVKRRGGARLVRRARLA